MGSFDIVPQGEFPDDNHDGQAAPPPEGYYFSSQDQRSVPHDVPLLYDMEGVVQSTSVSGTDPYFAPQFTAADTPPTSEKLDWRERAIVIVGVATLTISAISAVDDILSQPDLTPEQQRVEKVRDTVNAKLYADGGFINFHICLDGTSYPQENIGVSAAPEGSLYDVSISSTVTDEPPLEFTAKPTRFLSDLHPADTYTENFLNNHNCG